MDDSFIIAVLICLLLFLTCYYIYKFILKRFDKFSISYNVVKKAKASGKDYHVHSKHDNLEIATNVFSEIDSKINKLLSYLSNKYKEKGSEKRKEISRFLVERYNYNNLRESSPLNVDNDTSYTINKGDIIAICIRSGINYGIHEIDTIMFVVIHEITHISISAYDHPEEFWQVFKFLLMEAEEGGIYVSQDYEAHPVEYCGITINYNPRYDVNIKIIP